MKPKPIKVFISYAREDEKHKNDLVKHLKPLKRQGIIHTWDDGDIQAGSNWDETIKQKINHADVVIFLVSPDFLASDYIDGVELKYAKERHKKREATLIPIVVRPTDLSFTELRKFQMLPRDAKPISSWQNKDEAWLTVTVGLRHVFNTLKNQEEAPIDNDETESTHAPPIDTSTTDKTNEAKQAISKGRTSEAIEVLEKIVQDNSNLSNELILLKSRLTNIERSERLGTMADNLLRIEKNKINASLLSFIDEL